MLEIAYNYRHMELDSVPLFAGLTSHQRDWLRSRLYARKFPAGIDMIVSGAPGEMLYIILSGTMKVYVPQPDGTDVFIAIMGPGDTVGELAIVDQSGRSANVLTLEESQVMWMSQADFQEALMTMPLLARNLLRILSTRLRNTTNHFQAIASLDVDRRVARQILTFAGQYGRANSSGQVTIPIRLTQNDLAELIGASRKRVNQAMVVFKREGWVSVDMEYHITVNDQPALEGFLAS
jgi:CRP/FNR family cyclic AMP-dependent transcriptional regulator